MVSVVVDTSALIAILVAEPEAEPFMQVLDAQPSEVSAATLHEAFCVARRSGLANGRQRLQRLIDLAETRIFPFDEGQISAARDAYDRYGRGTGHAANLNMGDCFSYALARTRDLPLLFKGDGFPHTDVKPALPRPDQAPSAS